MRVAAASDFIRLARLAEDSGFDLIGIQDHPYQSSFLDSWALITYLLAKTKKIAFSSNVGNLGLRSPAMLAKAASSLALLEPGRVHLGVGAGAVGPGVPSIDARPTATFAAECGLAYYSRHYRLRSHVDLPGPRTTRIVAGLNEFTVGIWSGDNDTMVLLVAPISQGKRFRGVHDADVFTAVLRTIPVYREWLEVLEPISPIFPMGGLHNTLRLLAVDGSPVAYGLHAIGDTVCTTNPTLGRGLGLALREAVDLVDVIDDGYEHPADLAMALHERIDSTVSPFYADQANIDAARLAQLRHTISGGTAPDARDREDRVTYAQLRNAAPFDPTVFRAFWKIMGMTCLPDSVYIDPTIVVRTHEVIRSHGAGPPIAQPTRDQLLVALGQSHA